MSGGEGITVDVILPMEKAGSERVRRAAVARKLGISPSRIKDVRLVKESIDSRQKKILFQLRLLVGVDSPLPPERLPSRDYPSVRPGADRWIRTGRDVRRAPLFGTGYEACGSGTGEGCFLPPV